MAKLLTEKEVGGSSNKYVSANDLKNYGWQTAASGNSYTSNAYITINWEGNDSGQSQTTFSMLGMTIQQIDYVGGPITEKGFATSLSGTTSSYSGYKTISKSESINIANLNIAPPVAGYALRFTAFGMPDNYQVSVAYPEMDVMVGNTITELLEYLQSKTFHIATQYTAETVNVAVNNL